LPPIDVIAENRLMSKGEAKGFPLIELLNIKTPAMQISCR